MTHFHFLRLTIFLLLTASSCSFNKSELFQLEGEIFVKMESLPPDFTHNSVLLVYDPECPVCLLYKTSVDYLSKTYTAMDWKVIVPAGADTSLIKDRFYKDSKISFYYETKNAFLKKIGATTTPQVFVFDEQGEFIYSGKIDNRVKALGVKTSQPDSLYLSDALKALANGTLPEIKTTEPIGCFIQ